MVDVVVVWWKKQWCGGCSGGVVDVVVVWV